MERENVFLDAEAEVAAHSPASASQGAEDEVSFEELSANVRGLYEAHEHLRGKLGAVDEAIGEPEMVDPVARDEKGRRELAASVEGLAAEMKNLQETLERVERLVERL